DITNFDITIGSLSGGGTTGGNVTLGTQNLTVGGNNENTTFGGVIGTGGTAGVLTKTGGGILTLTGTNLYTGGTNLNGGFLNINSTVPLGASTGGVTFNGGGIQWAASNTNNAYDISSRTLIFASTALLDTAGNQVA